MTPGIPIWFDAEKFREQGQRIIDDLATFLEDSTTGNAAQVLPWRDENAQYDAWKELLDRDIELEELFREVCSASIRLHHPRYLGHQISPPATASALAGFVADTLNNGMGVYEMGMAGTVMERLVIEMLARQFGFADSASGFLTSGGSMGNLTALLAARNTADPDVLEAGNRDQQYAVMISEQAHYCIQRAAGIMGWGRQGIITVPVDEHYSMRVDLLPELYDQATRSGKRVVAVVGSACSTATGAYDDLAAISQFCSQRDLWFHVDGAHGAAAAFSQKYRCRLDGIELANSVTLDFHKLLLVPALATAVVFRDAGQSYVSFAQKAEYLFDEHVPESQWHNLALRTFECTKAMMSLKVISVLAEHGLAAWDANVTQLYDLANKFADMIDETPAMELLVRPQSNIVCYRYVPANAEQANAINRDVRERLLHEGKFYVVQTISDGTHWLRTTIGSSLTTTEHLGQLLEEVTRIGQQLESQARGVC